MPREIDPQIKFGKGFSNVEYSFMAEEMGRSPFAAEVGAMIFERMITDLLSSLR